MSGIKPSEICCPYDGKECGDRRIAFEAWKEPVEYCAKNGIDYMFHTSGEQYCPRAFDDDMRKAKCYRYRMYLEQQKKISVR